MTSEHFSSVINIKDYIDYQGNSIVSKVLMSNGKQSVTLFAFDKDQAIDTHTAPMDAMVSVLDGEAEIVIAEQGYNLKAGEIIIMPANIPHSLKAKNKFKMLLTKV